MISFKEKFPSVTLRELSSKFDLCLGVIHRILKNKEKLKNIPSTKIKKIKREQFPLIDQKTFELFVLKRQKNFITNGDLIKRAALRISKAFGIKDFKASNGWLDGN